MWKLAGLTCLLLTIIGLAACAPSGRVPANYYENDLHHGYPGPGVTDPSAT